MDFLASHSLASEGTDSLAPNRVVVKIGTNVLVSASGRLDLSRMRDLAEEVCDLHDKGSKIVVVTSGAIAAGRDKLGLEAKPESLPLQQASAAVGQGVLMAHYSSFFEKRGKKIAQLLVTEDDFEGERLANLLNTFETLFALGVIPVVNENDSVSTSELEFSRNGGTFRAFGDNDMLSALIASALKAGALVLLSDVDGLLDGRNRVVRAVEEIDGSTYALDRRNGRGRGGLASKLKAARKACDNGVTAWLANGRKENALKRIFSGRGEGTLFKARQKPAGDYALELAARAKNAQRRLERASAEERNATLLAFASLLEKNRARILEANSEDVGLARKGGARPAAIDRLALDQRRVSGIVSSVESAAAKDVLDKAESWELENGLKVARRRVPFGVVLFIFEGRPNVAADACALAVKTGNAIILKGSRSAANSNRVIAGLAREALGAAGLDADAVQLFGGSQEDFMRLLRLDRLVDLAVPRGGEELIAFLKKNSSAPLLFAGGGVCHVYVDEYADGRKAVAVVANAKTQRPSACNAAEVLLVHASRLDLLRETAKRLAEEGVELRCCSVSYAVLSQAGLDVKRAAAGDFETEFGDKVMAVKVVGSLAEAIRHVNAHGTRHSDAIVTEDRASAEAFLEGVDSACVYWNASTRFSDAKVLGFGPELCISTQKLHGRGPLSFDSLYTTKLAIEGNGQVRE